MTPWARNTMIIKHLYRHFRERRSFFTGLFSSIFQFDIRKLKKRQWAQAFSKKNAANKMKHTSIMRIRSSTDNDPVVNGLILRERWWNVKMQLDFGVYWKNWGGWLTGSVGNGGIRFRMPTFIGTALLYCPPL